jgi:hypothetical protein
MARSRTSAIVFWLWTSFGGLVVAANGYVSELYWSYHPQMTFRPVNPTREQQEQQQFLDRLSLWRDYLPTCSVAYGLLGLVLIKPRSCITVGVAVAIILLPWLVQMASGLGHL